MFLENKLPAVYDFPTSLVRREANFLFFSKLFRHREGVKPGRRQNWHLPLTFRARVCELYAIWATLCVYCRVNDHLLAQPPGRILPDAILKKK